MINREDFIDVLYERGLGDGEISDFIELSDQGHVNGRYLPLDYVIAASLSCLSEEEDQ